MRTLLLTALLSAALPTLAADRWTVQPDDSRLGFTATQQGGEFDGRFRAFSADLHFSPDDLTGSNFDVSIDTGSIDTGSQQRDRELPGEDWFNTERYPQATLRTTEIRRSAGDRYEAVGDLTIRDHSREIVLPFTWVISGDRATMTGEVTIDRTNYGVGQGQWSEGDTVGRKVTVEVNLELHREN